MADVTLFGAVVLRQILDDDYFFEGESSEEWCELLQKFGYAEKRPYDPAIDGELDYEPGDLLWFFTEKMREDAAK